jgi:hypothetical protein
MSSSFRHRLTVYRIAMQNGTKWEIKVGRMRSYPLARWVGRPLTAPKFTHIPPISKAPNAAFLRCRLQRTPGSVLREYRPPFLLSLNLRQCSATSRPLQRAPITVPPLAQKQSRSLATAPPSLALLFDRSRAACPRALASPPIAAPHYVQETIAPFGCVPHSFAPLIDFSRAAERSS